MIGFFLQTVILPCFLRRLDSCCGNMPNEGAWFDVSMIDA